MQHLKIKTRTLSSGIVLTFNLFIKVNNKFLLYVRIGDELTLDRLSRLKDKAIVELYIPFAEADQYHQFLDNMLESGMDHKKSNLDKAKILSQHSEQTVENFIENFQDVSAFKSLEKAALSLISGIGKKSDMLKEFYKEVFTTDSDLMTKHAVATTSLVVCFCEKIKLDSITQNNLAIAAMLMDLGLSKIAIEYRNKIYSSETSSEIPKEVMQIYYMHPELSTELLHGKNYINKEILTFVLTHEERKSGNGFPCKIKTLSREQQILGLGHSYALKTSCLKMSYKDAYQSILIDEVGNFDLSLLTTFKEMLKDQGMEI